MGHVSCDLGRSYKIRVPKLSGISIRTSRHIETVLIAVKNYLRDEVVKDKSLRVNRLKELVEQYA